ncbi:hypothetical protein DIPPA_25822 [Diplonema papillatum]|nr:hypothetical protein DIPPA_25822 [Diplonema papillatum]
MAEDNDRKEKRITMATLSKTVFEKFGAVQGKWCFQIDRDEVDHVWESMCHSLYNDFFEDRLQVSAAMPQQSKHCIAVLTNDYTDFKHQERMVKAVRSTGVQAKLFLKPTAASVLQLYPQRYPWNDRATSLYVVPEHQPTILHWAEFSKRNNISQSWKSTRLSEAL